MTNIITNPILKEFKDLKLIHNKNLGVISNSTRDAKIKVLQDKESRIIILKKYKKKNYYKNKDLNIKINNEDDLRRYKQFKKLFKGRKKILDFGCGWGGFLNNFKDKQNVIGVEIRESCKKFINKKFKFHVYDDLSYISNKFDIITMFHVLEHIPYQLKVLKNLKKKLKNKGKIIIEVPHAQDFLLEILNLESFKKFTFWSEHLVLHTEKSLKKLLKEAGYKNIRINFYQRYNLNNHFGWMLKNKPGGHKIYKNLFKNKIKEKYENFLINKKLSDTLIAIADN